MYFVPSFLLPCFFWCICTWISSSGQLNPQASMKRFIDDELGPIPTADSSSTNLTRPQNYPKNPWADFIHEKTFIYLHIKKHVYIYIYSVHVSSNSWQVNTHLSWSLGTLASLPSWRPLPLALTSSLPSSRSSESWGIFFLGFYPWIGAGFDVHLCLCWCLVGWDGPKITRGAMGPAAMCDIFFQTMWASRIWWQLRQKKRERASKGILID